VFFFLDQKLLKKSRTTPEVTAISATLKTAKYCTDIISVTDPKRVRSRALRAPHVKMSKYPIFSFSDIFFHEKIINPRSISKISGMIIWMPGRGVLKAIPVFLKRTIRNQSPISEILGIAI
jgi:hypothetical protein